MPKKRRNNGKNRKNRGHVRFLRCDNCYRAVPKDKAIKRFLVKNMVETAGQRDIKDASVYKEFTIPKFYCKVQHCISCALHARIVRVRSATDSRVRTPPKRFQRK